MDLIPRKTWHGWRFRRPPLAFWDVAENRHRYLRWLGKELGFRKPEDWYRVSYYDIRNHYGRPLYARIPALCDVMRDFLPQLNWDHLDKRHRLTEGQILAWLDAYHAKHGRWPTRALGADLGDRLHVGCSGNEPGTGRPRLAQAAVPCRNS